MDSIVSYKKNEEIVIKIDDMGKDGEGIGHVDGYAFFVKGALVGETVRASVMKTKKKYGFAHLLEVVESSPHRCAPLCSVAGPCGGCSLQHMDYLGQLIFKEKKVRDCLIRLGGVNEDEIEWLPIIGMNHSELGAVSEPWHYRNKAQFPVRADAAGKPAAGFFAGRSHRLIVTEKCGIQHPVIDEVVQTVLHFLRKQGISAYDEISHKGLVRHIYVRRGYYTGQIMVCLVVNGETLPKQDLFVDCMRRVKGMTSIFLNINCERTNVILGRNMKLLWGEETIEDCIGEVRYRISPQSFYQVNPVQTEKLYRTALAFADLQGDETVWDLYCGIGTISLFLASQLAANGRGRVIGVEIVPEAIDNARENARQNGLSNVQFYCGAAENVVDNLVSNGTSQADVVVVDPPRKGCDAKLLDTIVEMSPKKVVYVSCDPATLARDVKILAEKGYGVKKVRACDMFPQGGHVETCVLLSKLKSAKSIEVKIELDDMDLTQAEGKATYAEIKQYVMENAGLNVSQLFIAQVKRKYGLIERMNYNVGNGKSRVPQVTPEKEKAIEDALRHFKMI